MSVLDTFRCVGDHRVLSGSFTDPESPVTDVCRPLGTTEDKVRIRRRTTPTKRIKRVNLTAYDARLGMAASVSTRNKRLVTNRRKAHTLSATSPVDPANAALCDNNVKRNGDPGCKSDL